MDDIDESFGPMNGIPRISPQITSKRLTRSVNAGSFFTILSLNSADRIRGEIENPTMAGIVPDPNPAMKSIRLKR